ncbi:MAG: CDP-alcohol phosphatidyltransferase family protein [Akkermansiaceae bacterium]|nr:CDP-alcohol phosphatidyltransferase family protein [Akkermansiaceae bacterium]
MGDDYKAADRRPIATRGLRASQSAASALARAGVSANAISVAGMLVGILAGAAFAATAGGFGPGRPWWILGAALVQLRLLANMFDGMVAIERGTASPTGELYNEVPDRVSDTATLVGLGYAALSVPVLGFLAAGAAMFTAYIRATGKAAGARHEFCGPFAKPQRMFLVTLCGLWCGLTPPAWQAIPALGPVAGIPAITLAVIAAGSLLTALRRLAKIAAALKRPT